MTRGRKGREQRGWTATYWLLPINESHGHIPVRKKSYITGLLVKFCEYDAIVLALKLYMDMRERERENLS